MHCVTLFLRVRHDMSTVKQVIRVLNYFDLVRLTISVSWVMYLVAGMN